MVSLSFVQEIEKHLKELLPNYDVNLLSLHDGPFATRCTFNIGEIPCSISLFEDEEDEKDKAYVCAEILSEVFKRRNAHHLRYKMVHTSILMKEDDWRMQ